MRIHDGALGCFQAYGVNSNVRRWLLRVGLALFALAGPSRATHAADVPPGFVDRQVASGLTSPTAMAVLPDGRVLVLQQNGDVRIIVNDALLPTRFYRVTTDFSNERGLLGVTVDPGFAINQWVYLYFTATTPTPHNRILRVTASGNVAMPGTEKVIFDLPPIPPETRWHMGGALRFGPDGKLYVAVGNHEDEWRSPEDSNSQNLSNPFGKILRINPDGSIPGDNPFVGTPGAYRASWNLGLRNPFTFDIHPTTGQMFINDVGQGSWEEINEGQPGGNYGWPSVEGRGDDSRYLDPAYTYSHDVGCSVVGGVFYTPQNPQFPGDLVDKYLFADFCGGWIQAMDPATKNVTPFVTDIGYPVNLQLAPDGSLYYLARNQQTGDPDVGAGTVGKITYTGSRAPRITTQPVSQTILVGTPVTFRVAAVDATGYQWQRNGADIAGATGSSYTIASTAPSDSGSRFRVVVRNAFDRVTSSEAVLTVTTNRPPTATIVAPVVATSYEAGDVIHFSGTGSDPEDGALPASAFIWQVDFHHDTHSHPFVAPTVGIDRGTFTIPAEDVEDNVWYRIYLTVRDSGGGTQTVTRDIRPGTSLSDLTTSRAPVNGWGPIERDTSNGEDAGGDGNPMSLDGIPYAKGLGVHADSDVRFNLRGTCSGRFLAHVGIDDEVQYGSVVFQVWLDNVMVFDSGVMEASDPRKVVNLPIAGRRALRLVVTDAGDGNGYDHADWAGARVTGCRPPRT